jgi:hypothetical protein
MGLPYKILLYNNGKRVNVLDRVDNYSNAVKIYNQIVKDNKCYFPKNYNWLGKETDYEVVLTGPKTGTSITYFRNDLGALVKVIPKGNFVIKKITPYCIEEVFKHKNTDTKHTFRTLVKNFLVNNTNTRVILSINNKLVIQYFENDALDVFVLKNREDSQRLNETIREFSYANGLTNFIFFNDPTIDTIRPIYDSLEANYGISREWMSRVSTR